MGIEDNIRASWARTTQMIKSAHQELDRLIDSLDSMINDLDDNDFEKYAERLRSEDEG